MVITMAVAFTAFTFLASAGRAETESGVVARFLRRLPLQSVKIIIVMWQIVTQVCYSATPTSPIFSLYQLKHTVDGNVEVPNTDIVM